MKANFGQFVVYVKDGEQTESEVTGIDFGYCAGYRLKNGDWVSEKDVVGVMTEKEFKAMVHQMWLDDTNGGQG